MVLPSATTSCSQSLSVRQSSFICPFISLRSWRLRKINHAVVLTWWQCALWTVFLVSCLQNFSRLGCTILLKDLFKQGGAKVIWHGLSFVKYRMSRDYCNTLYYNVVERSYCWAQLFWQVPHKCEFTFLENLATAFCVVPNDPFNCYLPSSLPRSVI